MTDRFKFDLVADSIASASNKSRRAYSQRNVSSLQHELTKNRKMINMKSSSQTSTMLNRTLSFKPMPVTTNSISANVENTPIKLIPIQTFSTNVVDRTKTSVDENFIVEETPMKEETPSSNELLAREIQRLSLRLRSSTPLYNVPVMFESQTNKPATLHLSQVVNRVSRCHYVLRRYVREAEKYCPKPEEKLTTTVSTGKTLLSNPSHEKGRRRLFVDSPKQEPTDQPPLTPRKASGVIKQLFSSPSSSLKRSLPSPNTTLNTDKRARLF